MTQVRRKAKKRERPLGVAVGFGLVATLAVSLVIFTVLFLIPSSTLHNFFLLAHYNSSATLRSGPLFQQWAEKLQELEALFVTPFSLFCGGLTLGCLAPRYASSRRVLTAGAWMAFGVVAVSLVFEWSAAVIEQEGMNRNEGGYVFHIGAPPDLIVRQTLWALIWIAVCVGGTWMGQRLRDRKSAADTPQLRPSPR